MTSSVNSALSSLADLRQQLFTKSDADKSGTLSLDEFKKLSDAMKSSGMTAIGGKGQSIQSTFAQLDTNGDGQLTQTEMEAGAKLADQITAILLQIQEIKNGGMFSSMLGGDSSSDISSIFGGSSSGSDSLAALLGGSDANSNTDPLTALLQGTSGSGDDSSSGADQLTSYIQQILANYQQTTEAADSSTAATGSTVSTAA